MKNQSGCFKTLLLMLGGFIFSLLLLSLLFNAVLGGLLLTRGGFRASLGPKGGEDEFPRFEETWSSGPAETAHKVVRLAVRGVIVRDFAPTWFGIVRDPVEDLLRQIRAATQDSDVRGLLLEVDSPGGGVTASFEIYEALLGFRAERPERFIVAHVGDLAASGGYLVACAADHIIAQPSSIVGSIGVILQTVNIAELAQRLGIQDETIKSGDQKDLLNPLRPATAAERAGLQALIDDAYEQFVAVVATRRALDREAVLPLADGRIFSAHMAHTLGLVDELGGWTAVLAETNRRAAGDPLQVVRYHAPGSFWTRLAEARLPWSPARWLEAAQPRRLYLWRGR